MFTGKKQDDTSSLEGKGVSLRTEHLHQATPGHAITHLIATTLVWPQSTFASWALLKHTDLVPKQDIQRLSESAAFLFSALFATSSICGKAPQRLLSPGLTLSSSAVINSQQDYT